LKPIIKFLQKILLGIELVIAIAVLNWEKTLFIGIIVLDQISKMHITNSMVLGETFPVINNFFYITYTLNPGAAFGILPDQRVFFLLIGVVLLAGFALFYRRINKLEKFLKSGIIMSVSGSVGNLIDRIQTGKVIDFLDFKVWTAIFNIADVAIVVGMFIIFYYVAFRMDDDGKIVG
jgi:signal peptidase II